MKTAIITGAAQNIGKGIANTLLVAGYKCVLLDKDKVSLQKTIKELSLVGDCSDYVMDISNTNEIDNFIDWLKEHSIEVDILVNNVGYNTKESVLNLTPKGMDLSNGTNLSGPFYLTSLICQNWVQNKIKGNVVFISSTHSKVVRTHPMYSASKAGIEMFVKEAALELAQYEIRVNAVAPGIVVDSEKPELNNLVPLGVNQQPSDIGEAVDFLVSDKARFVTGETLVVDGGFSLTHTHYWLKENRL